MPEYTGIESIRAANHKSAVLDGTFEGVFRLSDALLEELNAKIPSCIKSVQYEALNAALSRVVCELTQEKELISEEFQDAVRNIRLAQMEETK